MIETLGVTGHRPQKLHDNRNRLDHFAQAQLAEINPGRVLTGMAVGWDQSIARACIALRIPFEAVVPFRGQEERWPQALQDEYWRLLNAASSVKVVSPGGFTVKKMHKRNHYIVNMCDELLALYDGNEGGGTFECVSYAERCAVPVRNVWSSYQDYVRELSQCWAP